MRNVKKFLALVLAMLMVVSAAATVSAFEDVADDHVFAAAINDLTVKEIVNGYDGETFGPDDAVTRQQMALMMARAITGNVGDDAVWAQGGLVGFEDVTEYQYAIATVVKAGIVDGFLDNTFRPEEGITFVQALKMAVCALGYDDGNLEWWNGYYNVALDLGLTENLNYITDADKALNRGEVAQLIYNMLYVELADGSDCFASQNFGLATAENVTTFAIVATPKQCATETTGVSEGGYVGLQEIINGVPAGDIAYIAIDEFDEFDADTVEEFFGYAYNLVNWNDGEYDDIIAIGTVDKIYNTEITESSPKFTYDGKNYYPVESLTSTPIRNEVVIYNAVNHEYVHTAKILLLDKEGEVWLDMNGDGVEDELALKAVYSVNGEIISYRDYYAGSYDATTGLYAKKVGYLDEAKATAKYGVDVESGVDSLEFLTVATLAGAYELTIFDDDMDGKMDRAYYTPVYVGVYNPKNSSSQETFGPMKGTKGVTYVDDETRESVTLTKGDVFKYTYNPQTKVVDVMDTYEVQTGKLTRISTLNDKSSAGNQSNNYYAVKLTIDGEVYTLGNTYREAQGVDGFTIYDPNGTSTYGTADDNVLNVKYIANLTGKDENGDTFYPSNGRDGGTASIGYTYKNNITALDADQYVRFVAVEDTIILAEPYDIMEAYELVVVEDIIDYDLEAVYMDVWMSGELVEDVAVSKIWDEDEGEYVTLADLNVFKLYNLVGELSQNIKGNIYRAIPAEDGTYQISEAFVNDADTDRKQIVKDDKIKANDFGLAYIDSSLEMVFDDGIGEIVGHSEKYPNDALVLRTDDDTLFYFLKKDGEEIDDIYTFVGQPADGASLDLGRDDDAVQVYANKLGYATTDPTNGVKGVADVVVVYYTDVDDIKGFGITDVGEKIVYVSWIGDTEYHDGYIRPSDRASASELGLGREYSGQYYVYSGDYGINMHSGARITKIYSKVEISNDTYYVLSNDNVVILDSDNDPIVPTISTQTGVVRSDVTISRFHAVAGIFTKNAEVGTVKFLTEKAKVTSSAVKTDDAYTACFAIDADKNEYSYTVEYIADDLDDGIFVGIVANKSSEVVKNDTGDEDETTTTTATVEWTTANGDLKVGVNTLAAAADTNKLTGTVTLCKAAGKIGDTITAEAGDIDAEEGTITGTIKAWDETTWGDASTITVTASVVDGKVTITKAVYTDNAAKEVTLVDGTDYQMYLTITTKRGNTIYMTANFEA